MATLTMNVFSLALPIVLLQVYDRVVPNDAGHTAHALGGWRGLCARI